MKPAAAILSFIILLSSCSNLPQKDPYQHIAGFVIGRETCHTDTTQDSWLLDMTVDPFTAQVGDPVTYNGTGYTNVLKIRDLHPNLQSVGMKVAIDYQVIKEKSTSIDCNVPTPIVYPLKEIIAIHQGLRN